MQRGLILFLLHTDADGQQIVKVYFRHFMSLIIELLQDPKLKEHIDFCPKPFIDAKGERILGTFTGGYFYQASQANCDNSTVIVIVVYSDATSFFKSGNTGSAHPVISKPNCCRLLVYSLLTAMSNK